MSVIDLSAYRGRRIAVLGLGKSGLSAAQALVAGGAEVMAWDDGEAGRVAAEKAGITVTDLRQSDWAGFEFLVLSPGIPHDHPRPHPVPRAARRAGVPLVCDIELLYRAQPHARYLGVTGTNGKSTTTALTTHILTESGRKAVAGGNIGVPALSLEPLDRDGIYVLEMSSYQLELVPSVTFDVAVLLNISPDHLDRHGGLHSYVAAKERIFRGPNRKPIAVIGIDDHYSAYVAEKVRGADRRVVPISSARSAVGGISAVGGELRDDSEGGGGAVTNLLDVRTLPGSHNWQNAAAAYAVARLLDVPANTAAAAMQTYPGLPHRQEQVAIIAGVRYVNDSKATNADSAARALGSYDEVYWIAGGLAKEGGIAALAPLFPRVRHAFLIGAAAGEFADTLAGHVPVTRSGDLASALQGAHALAQAEQRPGAVVLLSPACASFDQWANFEARGNAFRAAAHALAQSAERAA